MRKHKTARRIDFLRGSRNPKGSGGNGRECVGCNRQQQTRYMTFENRDE
ncbi:MAG: hypothetical protein JWQ87_3805 [Candidatus Sulfotelmatobacter sp.]|nr:hypothetical protein [Candidatus Sulfotelmatobacter sp.]